MKKFSYDYLNNSNNQKKISSIISVLNEQIQSIIFKSNEDYNKIKNTTSGLKITASLKAIKILKEIEMKTMELSNHSLDILKKLPTLMSQPKRGNELLLDPKLKGLSQEIIKKKEELITEIRNEMDKI